MYFGYMFMFLYPFQKTRVDAAKAMVIRCRKKITNRLNFMYKRKHGERKLNAFLGKMLDRYYELEELETDREMKIILDVMEEENLEPFRLQVKLFLRDYLFDY
jgi:hypothetical protein